MELMDVNALTTELPFDQCGVAFNKVSVLHVCSERRGPLRLGMFLRVVISGTAK
jgi:hypothetical protein